MKYCITCKFMYVCIYCLEYFNQIQHHIGIDVSVANSRVAIAAMKPTNVLRSFLKNVFMLFKFMSLHNEMLTNALDINIKPHRRVDHEQTYYWKSRILDRKAQHR